jgi:hypothetical protein
MDPGVCDGYRCNGRRLRRRNAAAFGVLLEPGPLYLALNLVGAALTCLSSYLIDFMPFVLLEGTWAMVAAIALGRNLLRIAHPAP